MFVCSCPIFTLFILFLVYTNSWGQCLSGIWCSTGSVQCLFKSNYKKIFLKMFLRVAEVIQNSKCGTSILKTDQWWEYNKKDQDRNGSKKSQGLEWKGRNKLGPGRMWYFHYHFTLCALELSDQTSVKASGESTYRGGAVNTQADRFSGEREERKLL